MTTEELDAPYAFRRAVHAFGACFVVWYLIPPDGAWGLLKWVLPLAILALVAALETLRLGGRLPAERFFGLREYERTRLGGYAYFGLSTVLLLYLAPEAVAVPCLVGMSLLDPLAGEARRAGRRTLGFVLGALLAAALFALYLWPPWLAAASGTLMAASEAVKFRHLDDDLLMALLPAAFLFAVVATGLATVPDGFLGPWRLP
jgi:dolichol kinase